MSIAKLGHNVTPLFGRMPEESWPFLRFWLGYPKKVDELAAQRAWARLSDTDRRECMQRVAVIVRYWERTSTPRRYVPNPSTFLNNRRWRDHVEDLDEPASDLGQCFWNRNGNRDANAGQCAERAVASDHQGNCYCSRHARSLGLKVRAP